MSASRATARIALADLLVAHLPDVQAVYPHQVADFGGQSPVLVITSAGSERARMTMRGSRATFQYNLHVFVLYSDTQSGWTEADAEAALDAIEQQIAATLDTHMQTDAWQHIAYRDASQADGPPPVIAGDEYRHEIIPVAVMVHQ